MNRLLLLVFSIMFLAACSMSESDVVEETLAASEEVNNYTLDITSINADDTGENEFILNIDQENTRGYITSHYSTEYESSEETLYYNNDTVYHNVEDSGWEDSGIQVEEMHEFYFIDYTQIARALEYIQSTEESTFESLDDTYEFSYQTENQEDTENLMEEWGYNIDHEFESFTNASIVFNINQDNYYINTIELEYTVHTDNSTEINMTQQLEYQDINNTDDIEAPDDL